MLRIAGLVKKPGVVTDRNNRPHGVEEVGKHQGEHHQQGAQEDTNTKVPVGKEPTKEVNMTEQAQIGPAEIRGAGQTGHVEAQPVGFLSLCAPMFPTASMATPTSEVPMIAMSIDPLM